jgi:hypothetical protein
MNNTSKISCCNACLLASAMKSCPTCPFNPGNMKLTPTEQAQVERTELLQGSKQP